MFKRGFLLILGLVSLFAGLLGIILPLVPTVPFVLLSAYCFARSSSRLNVWLHNHPWFADALSQWEQQGALKKSLKLKAVVMTVCSFLISILLVPVFWIKVMLIIMCISLLIYLYRLPVIDDDLTKN